MFDGPVRQRAAAPQDRTDARGVLWLGMPHGAHTIVPRAVGLYAVAGHAACFAGSECYMPGKASPHRMTFKPQGLPA